MSAADLPVVLLLFADDRQDRGQGHLRALIDERRRIVRALRPRDGRSLRLVVEPNVTLDLLFELIDAHGDRIVGVHYAGHADGDALHFEDAQGAPTAAYRDGLADALGRLPDLRWVFLNGCATEAHVAALHGHCRAPVIATERSILDTVATDFAARFYSALGRGASLRDGFTRAAASGRARHASPDDARRMLRPGAPTADDDRWPWALQTHPAAPDAPDWQLPGARPVPWRVLVAALVSAAVAGLVVWGLMTPDPPSPQVEPPADAGLAARGMGDAASRTPAPLRLLDPRVRADELSLQAPDAPAEVRLDGRLMVRCGPGEPSELELVETAESTSARRRFAPRVDGLPAVLPSGPCRCALTVTAADGRVGTLADVCAGAPSRARFAFYHRDAVPDREFVDLLGAVSEAVGSAARRAAGRDVEPILRSLSSGHVLVRSQAMRIARAGGLLQIIWRHTSPGGINSRVLIPFEGLLSAGGGLDALLTVPLLSKADRQAYAITHKFHELVLLASLAAESRGRQVHVEAAYLGDVRLAHGDLQRLVSAVDGAGVSADDRAALSEMQRRGRALFEQVELRLAELSAAPTGGTP